MSHINSWSNPSKSGAAEAIQMAAFLEERSSAMDMRDVNQKLSEVLNGKPGEQLLEVGCGSGVICRLVLPFILPSGIVTGLDISPDMSAEAIRYTQSAGMQSSVAFSAGTAESLPYPEASFDGAWAARLLLHVANPVRVIVEMARVVRPGGWVVVMDWDYETVTVDHPDRDLTRRVLHWRTDHHGGDNWSGRALWRWMRLAGLQRITVHPYVSIAHSELDSLTQSLWRAAKGAYEGGAISAMEQDAWVQELRARIQSELFFASINYFILKGTVVSVDGRNNAGL
jgi:ubiquinone/menaquinone biosynthesis C-methylase UbiE